MSQIMHTLRINDVKRETPDTVSVSFDMPSELVDKFGYVSGQYLTLEAVISGEKVRRAYSLCSAPEESEWRVAIKKVENGKFSTFANDHLKVGDSIDVMPPMGNFKLATNSDNVNQYMAYAAGSGITPIISMIKSVLAQEEQSKFILVYGNKNKESTIFLKELSQLQEMYTDRLIVHHIYSRAETESSVYSGRIDGQKCDEFSKNIAGQITAYYLCGPSQMIFEVKDALIAQGVASGDIHFELFNTDDLPESESTEKTEYDTEATSQVTVIVDGDEYEFELAYGGPSILEAALEEDADLPFACKGGVCCTCKARIEEGEVQMDVNYSLEPEEVEDGFVLTCQSHPRTSKVVISFD